MSINDIKLIVKHIQLLYIKRVKSILIRSLVISKKFKLKETYIQNVFDLVRDKYVHLFLKYNRDYILNYYSKNNNGIFYEKELSFLRRNEEITIFPYAQIKEMDEIISGFDSVQLMPFVLHKNKKLYFPVEFSVEKAVINYKNYICTENILGGQFSEKAPHQYQTEAFCVHEDDVVLDVGCAEALFALDIIDKAKKVYLFENDEKWIKPLSATFQPYSEKVVIINKLVSNVDTLKSITLTSALQNENEDNLFIKMDIEGYECEVIKSSEKLLSQNRNIKIACCTYHRQEDAFILKNLFEKLKYKIEFSDGFMIPLTCIKPPYFRNGIIRAHKEKT